MTNIFHRGMLDDVGERERRIVHAPSFRALLEQQHYTHDALARKTQIPRRTITSLASGERPGSRLTPTEWRRLARALCAPLDHFTFTYRREGPTGPLNGRRANGQKGPRDG